MAPTPDGTETHLAYLSGFFLILDTDLAEWNYGPGEVLDINDNLLTPVENRPTWDNPNPGHSAVPFLGRPFSFHTDEICGTFTSPAFGCPWGWARAIQVATGAASRHRRVQDPGELLSTAQPVRPGTRQLLGRTTRP